MAKSMDPKQVATKKTEDKQWPPYKPPAYAGGNLLLGGLSYLLLRQYLRFFIFFALLAIITFISGLNIFGWIIVIASAIDAYIIAGKLRDKKIPEPKYNLTLSVIILAIWILGIVYTLYSLFFATGF